MLYNIKKLFALIKPNHGTVHPKEEISTSVFCFGRDILCEQVIDSAFTDGCVLLFGGRQAGKTTVLRLINYKLSLIKGKVDVTSQLRIPVFVDLMRLPYDSTPNEFFTMLVNLAFESCQRQVFGFGLKKVPLSTSRQRLDVEGFELAIEKLRSASGECDVRFLFLLDEAKRILSGRFPRGFQDNLFYLLFSNANALTAGSCNIVFAGAQDLYILCEDGTSPIGSRAAKHYILNLDDQSVSEIVRYYFAGYDDPDMDRIAKNVFLWVGGHAGLSDYFVKQLAKCEHVNEKIIEQTVNTIRSLRSELFQIWVNSMTLETRCVLDRLIALDSLSISEIAACLRKSSMAVHRVERVLEELLFIGIAKREGDRLLLCNRIFAEVARSYVGPPSGSEVEISVWNLIEVTEVGLRKLIRRTFQIKWEENADSMMQKALGDEQWKKIQENREKSIKSYTRSNGQSIGNDILDYTYLGQLGQLIVWHRSWELFRHMFRDKRDIEDILRDITPVRNDSAHFRSVPDQELKRCQVRCMDLNVIIEKNESSQ